MALDSTGQTSKGSIITGRVIATLISLFLLADGIAKLFKPEPVLKGTVELGYSESVIIPIGIVLTLCTVLFIIPKTAVLGAILLTGYLGGAVATHVRAGQGMFEISFPIVFGILIWGSLFLRDARIRALIPFRG